VITGERAVTGANGFNPSWQRHVAVYALADELLGQGRVLDLGCGTGHSHHLLAPRETVGVDREPAVLEGQGRPTVCADMRDLPFPDGSFDAVLCSHAIEHVPDPERVVAEAARVTRPGGTCLFATPNRLTFGVPDEVIDPYHYLEFDAAELSALCAPWFAGVRVLGLFGSPAYDAFHERELRRLRALLRRDPLRLRRLIPRRARQLLYDWRLTAERRAPDPTAAMITVDDFHLGEEGVDRALDLMAVCVRGPGPRSGPAA
jgi:SAM-dependent methyltransferase